MIRTTLSSLFLLLLAITLSGQAPASLSDFFVNVEQAKPSFVQFDTLGTFSFFQGEEPHSYYFETLEREKEWFFLSYLERDDLAYQLICECDLKQMQRYFSEQEQSLQKDHMGYGALHTSKANGRDFYQDQCLVSNYITPTQTQPPFLQAMLDGQVTPPQLSGKQLSTDVDAQMILREDGHWILDLEGQLPDNLILLRGEEHQLSYLRSADIQYYPADSVARWKTVLVEAGLPTPLLVGYPPLSFRNNLGTFRQLDVDNPTRAWNIQVLLTAADLPPQARLEAAGSVGLIVSDGNTNTVAVPFAFIEPEKTYEFTLDEDGKLSVGEANQPGNTTANMFWSKDMHWRRLVFFEESGDTLIRFQYDQVPTSFELTTDAGKSYGVQATVLSRETLNIPFKVNMSTDQLQVQEVRFERQDFQVNAPDNAFPDHLIEARYDLYCPKPSPTDDFILTAAYDDTGRDLLLAQPDSIEAANAWIADLEDKPRWLTPIEGRWKKGSSLEVAEHEVWVPHHHLKIRLWDRPAYAATAIYLEGEFYYESLNGQRQRKLWKDSLQLSSPNPIRPTAMVAREKTEGALSPSRLTISSPMVAEEQGLEALFELPLPKEHYYVRMDMQRSRLVHFSDSHGYDLLELEKQLKPWNTYLNKRRTEICDYEIPNLKPRRNYQSPRNVLEFLVQSKATPAIGATGAYGQAEIVYYCFDQREFQPTEQTIPYTKQEEIVLEMNGHIVTYKRSPFTKEIDGQIYSTYDLQNENLSVFIADIVAFDGDYMVSPEPPRVNPNYQNLLIPEDLGERPLVIKTYYVELHTHEETIDFEVSIGRTAGQ